MGGNQMGLHTKHIFLSSTIREFAGKHNAICIKISFSRRWMGRGWVDRKAGLLRCLFDVGGSAGVPPGGGGVWRPRDGPRAAPRPAKQKSEAGAKGPGLALSGRFAPCRRPPRYAGISTGPAIHPPSLSAPASSEQNEPAAPDERRAGAFRRKPREVFQPVFPRFFKSGRGAEPSAASGGKSEAEAQ